MADRTDHIPTPDRPEPGDGHEPRLEPVATRPFWRRRSTLIVVVIAVLVVLVIVVAVSVSHSNGAEPGSPASTTSASRPVSTSPSPSGPTASTPSSTVGAEATPAATQAPAATAVPTPGATTGSVPAVIGQVAEPRKGVVVKIAALEAVTGKADGVGEIGGPAIEFQAQVTNDTGAPLALDTATVTVTWGSAATPADELASSRKNFPASVAAGKTAVATYVFTLAESRRSHVTITFDYRAGTPVVAFSGAAPR